MSQSLRIVGLAVASACVAYAPPGLAQADPNGGKSSGPITLLPSIDVVSDVLSRHLPGQEYSAGDGWWALACPDACKLYSMALSIESVPHPVYDGEDVPGQMLGFAPVPPVERVLMAFHPGVLQAQLQLRAGPLTTYYPGRDTRLRPSSSPGNMEAEFGLPDGRVARLIPTVTLSEGQAAAPPTHSHPVESPPALHLELEVEGRRQALGEFSFGIEGQFPLRPNNYIVWAGDLDRDGKPDFLLNFDFDGSNLVLFLSSLAGAGEIVGVAGSFIYYPVDSSGC